LNFFFFFQKTKPSAERPLGYIIYNNNVSFELFFIENMFVCCHKNDTKNVSIRKPSSILSIFKNSKSQNLNEKLCRACSANYPVCILYILLPTITTWYRCLLSVRKNGLWVYCYWYLKVLKVRIWMKNRVERVRRTTLYAYYIYYYLLLQHDIAAS